jgi:hypothetical protein
MSNSLPETALERKLRETFECETGRKTSGCLTPETLQRLVIEGPVLANEEPLRHAAGCPHCAQQYLACKKEIAAHARSLVPLAGPNTTIVPAAPAGALVGSSSSVSSLSHGSRSQEKLPVLALGAIGLSLLGYLMYASRFGAHLFLVGALEAAIALIVSFGFFWWLSGRRHWSGRRRLVGLGAIGLLGLFGVPTYAGHKQRSMGTTELFERAVYAQARHQFWWAEEGFREALRRKDLPESRAAKARLNLAICLQNRFKFSEAIKQYDQIIGPQSRNADMYYRRGICFYNQGLDKPETRVVSWHKALSDFRTARQLLSEELDKQRKSSKQTNKVKARAEKLAKQREFIEKRIVAINEDLRDLPPP